MAEETVQDPKSENAGQTSANSGGADGKAYTQAELYQMFAERARQAESSLLKKQGFERAEEAAEALGKLTLISYRNAAKIPTKRVSPKHRSPEAKG